MPSSDLAGRLSGLHVFIAEDEFHVLQLLEDMLDELGCIIDGSASSVPAALAGAGETQAQAALLDVNLRGRPIYPVARVLRDRAIPFVFSTGYGTAGIEPEWTRYPVLQKPFAIEHLAAALAGLVPSSR